MQASESGNAQAEVEAVDRVIRARKTSKLMLEPDNKGESAVVWTEEQAKALRTMVEGAAWAPFHKRADEQVHRQGVLDSVVPWRFHVLEPAACRSLMQFLQRQSDNQPDSKWSRAWQSKIKNMLAACGALVQATWLPDPGAEGQSPELSANNIEHIAASGAAIQNLLLAAEARGWSSYWSSGGILRDEEVFDHLGIGRNEVLLGSLFLAPAVVTDSKLIPGGLRDQRGPVEGWARWVTLAD
ncbi:nitroreductase family protein [Granulosicoccus antarcticus]|uniref:Nitroreductase domain-containing protein n=1 Tax=Granulosicoccus antarcticus IMCC3135 TaxID=1192854 RepID=A0A2Z2NZS9_9GAMM|nr:nitroreductase family protein [Granulosicoccus antarcticus]ASJ72634.1 hypothetical protein IMCC3135_12730 [Granulosicoccus antarcticus IMCC3135]